VVFDAITGTNPYYWALTDPRRDIIFNKCYNTGDCESASTGDIHASDAGYQHARHYVFSNTLYVAYKFYTTLAPSGEYNNIIERRGKRY